MIDIESELFNTVSEKVRAKYPKAFIVGEYVKSPSTFPCISIIETDNQVLARTRSSSEIENHVYVMYEVNVYSNKKSGKKAECKDIIAFIDREFLNLGFSRTLLNPIPDEDEATIYRMVGRYRAIVGRDKGIYSY